MNSEGFFIEKALTGNIIPSPFRFSSFFRIFVYQRLFV